ncbi:MAG: [protein-PII] uridylyltransferase [Candidatus Kryptoniota bacterium]
MLEEITAQLSERRKQARIRHESGGSGSEVSLMLTKAVDEVIRAAVEESEAFDSLSVIAIGGYGRAELCPHSDIDVMFLVENGVESGFLAQRVMHFLWDVGLNIGHSVRNIEQVLEAYRTDHDSWSSALEYRFVAGKVDLFNRYVEALRDFVSHIKDNSYVTSTLAGIEKRHEKYGKSTQLLEPNVKKSAGGLRDLHALLWMYRTLDPDFLSTYTENLTEPMVVRFLDLLLEKGLINRLQHTHTSEAFDFLLRTRQSLHYQSAGLNDLLDFEIQKKVAAGLGYISGDYSRGVESFMRDYYRHARKIYRLNQVLVEKIRAQVEPAGLVNESLELDENYVLEHGKIGFKSGVKLNGVVLFRAFLLKARTGKHFDENVREAIVQNLELFSEPSFRISKEVASIFRRILESEGKVGFTLKSMNELGVLGRYIPEFGKLIGFFQHNVYHYYTTDEHTLTALENLENVEDEFLRELLTSVNRKDALYLGVMFHDIAKPISIGKHEIIGVDVAREALIRMGFDEIVDDVSFLVLNHLKMEQVAFRRNIGDPETVYEFSKLFSNSERLKMLYLLTYADLSAVNPGVWTPWKAQLLQQLYVRTKKIIDESIDREKLSLLHDELKEEKQKLVSQRLPETMSEAVVRHFEGIENDLYLLVFDEGEIANHIVNIEQGFEDVRVSYLNSNENTDVTIIARDAPFQLSRFCAALSSNDANIVDANIFTRKDGIIIDRFKVFDNITKRSLTDGQQKKIEADLKSIIKGTVTPEELFHRHRMRWQRKLKNEMNPNIKVGVNFSETGGFSLIEIYAPDSLGFLYRVTSAISAAGLSIHFAKIATRVDGIVDTFYVLKNDGGLPDRRELEELEKKVLDIVNDSIQSELIFK